MSTAEWLPDLPADWDVARLSYLCRIGTGELDTIDADPEGSVPFYIRSPHVQRATSATGAGEAVLTPGDGAVGEVFHHHRVGDFAAHQRVYVLDRFDRTKLLPRFFYWYFSSRFRMVTSGGTAKSTVESLRRPMFTSFPVALPPLVQQRRIADYLDRETATIDALIEKQRRLVDGLKCRRRALLDEVWRRAQEVGAQQRLKWHLRPSSETAPPGEEVLSVYRDHGVVPKSSRTDNFNRTPENVERYLWVRAGDVVVNKMKAWQGSIAVSHHQGLVSPDYEVLRPTSQAFDLRFLHYLLRCPRMIAEYRTHSVGIRPAQWRLYWDRLGLIEVPVPTIGDQREIADHLDRETAKIDALIAKAERFIELAQERRAALITAAVTGQIEIPT
ncbi:restriction endonuclease subunit S [Micrococcus lylae]|uniref:restriction endonuclease subunit S n=1 Tax=Micrococcus lylae TaxID=1273 RepID=UPI0021A62DA3|nr:restriction endonuclease subunit S [Micrococcus lylae]MCT2008216.1 restriction endonuclease subunit S [Micrococcus lylae]MCT2072123.1 restriction endonuclease subunit S [Micrococcus lylae]